jgi:hypothetical protein
MHHTSVYSAIKILYVVEMNLFDLLRALICNFCESTVPIPIVSSIVR